METLKNRNEVEQQAASAQDGELSDQDLELVVGGADPAHHPVLS